jgi:hypothetical protein
MSVNYLVDLMKADKLTRFRCATQLSEQIIIYNDVSGRGGNNIYSHISGR